MTTHHPPEDAFDRWLDTLAEGYPEPGDDARAETAAMVHRHLGMPLVSDTALPAAARAAIRDRVFAPPAAAGAPATVASGPGDERVVPMARTRPAWRAVSLAAAAVLALLALATIAAFLRLNDGDDTNGFGAPASLLPFAPATALASPTPAASCATDDTLLLMPEEPVAPGALAHLPFPVAWYADSTLTVEQGGEVLREIEIGEADYLSPTGWPDVVLTGTSGKAAKRRFVNIVTGEMVSVGSSVRDVWSAGPFHFWTPDPGLVDWHVVDLRTFEHVALSDLFAFQPDRPWAPSIFSGKQVSVDGTVLLVEAYLASSMAVPNPDATPEPADPDLPVFDAGTDALIIDGSLDAISMIGPVATAHGDKALSADGQTVAWLAPSDTPGTRTLTVADVTTGEVLHTQLLQTEHAPSIRFDGTGTRLIVVNGASLDVLSLATGTATPAVWDAAPQLPDVSHRIVAMTADGRQVVLAEGGTVDANGTLRWLDLDTGESRKFTGQVQPGQILAPGSIRSADPLGTIVVIDDLDSELTVLELKSGDVIATLDRMPGRGALTILHDSSRLLVPREGAVDIVNLDDGAVTTIALSDGFSGVPWVGTSSDGGCATVTSFEADSVTGVTLIAPEAGTTHALPGTEGTWWLAGSP